MSSILSSKSQKRLRVSFSALQSHVSKLLGKIWRCTEATGTKLGEIGKGWKCSLARARCGIRRVHSGPDIVHEWFDISDRLVKGIDVSLVKLSAEWKCFSFLSLLVPVILFFGRSCGFTFLHKFLSPTPKTEDKYIYFTHFKLASFICFCCCLYERKVHWFYS